MRGKIRIDGRKNSLTQKGYPIIIYLTKDSKEKIIQTGYHAKKTHWNKTTGLPTPKHPNFEELVNYLQIKNIRLRSFLASNPFTTFETVEAYVMDFDSGIFTREAIAYTNTHDLKRSYAIALRSFDRMFPDMPYAMIDKSIAERFRDTILKEPVNGKPRSPNGVKSYLSSLSAVWNKLGKPDNPFSKVTVKAVPTKSKAMTDEDLRKIAENPFTPHDNATFGGYYHYLNYWMLCFYLGGCDLFDLAGLRWSDVNNNRVEFIRGKGGTNVFVSNMILPEAKAILDIYKGSDYLIPLRQNKLHNFHGNTSRVYQEIKDKLELSKKPFSKSPRYTFITRAQNLLIDERITIALVGHSQSSTHSIYKDEFPQHLKDKAHKRIINLNIQ